MGSSYYCADSMNYLRNKYKIFLKFSLYILAGLVLVTASFLLLVSVGVFGKLPDQRLLKQIQNPIATEVYSADGELMGTYYIENRQYLDP